MNNVEQGEEELSENPFFVGSPLWVAPYSDLICVNPIFCLINKVKSYGNKFKRSEVRMTGGN